MEKIFSNREEQQIYLGASVASGCWPCTKYHLKRSSEAGLTDIELANDPYYEEEPKVDPIFDRIGMGDEDAGTDRKICIFLVVLALVLLILVIVLATKFGF